MLSYKITIENESCPEKDQDEHEECKTSSKGIALLGNVVFEMEKPPDNPLKKIQTVLQGQTLNQEFTHNDAPRKTVIRLPDSRICKISISKHTFGARSGCFYFVCVCNPFMKHTTEFLLPHSHIAT